MRSAEQAGFFIHGRGRLVMPPRSTLGGTVVDQTGDGGGRGNDQIEKPPRNENEGPAIMNHPLIVGLLAALPEPGQEFDANEKEVWLKTLEMNLSVIYKPGRRPASAPPASSTPSLS